MVLFYIIFFFLILRFTVTLFNYISNPKLTGSPRQYHDLVSVLIPVRNEEKNIGRLLQSLLDQDYENFEVLILDDGSTDQTAIVCETFAKHDPRITVIPGKPLPANWLGKNYACHQLSGLARGKYLLFLDADETVGAGLINHSVHRIKLLRLSLLSLFTNQVMVTAGERLVVPLMHFILLNLLPLRLVRLSANPAFAAASGQFMLFEASDYHRHQWHEQVKQQVAEDIAIMRLVKAGGLRGEALLANGHISCRMYTGLFEALNGFSKNLLAGFSNSIPGLLIYLMLVMAGPVFIAIYLDLSLLFFALTLIVLSRILSSLSAGQNLALNVLLHPLQMVALLVIAILSIKHHLSRSATWKGRKIAS
ncbi:glycosyltransferase [Hufsiella ginkgonis]|uniref:Glycosyltransferase n=1 Tax=Hufsiella ginkgonis TaxID=2695274 RepID=A0A7K1XUV1_9SPHI|nr:glycosyltransferase family 2 protein [Hufsiella ginkgonis]MXV14750.1 glycosyltransferase [Hufsiella ginkgonis]